jgi:peptidoglycan/xylan/chitin deacetylase (PgdA/CDA1 family)
VGGALFFAWLAGPATGAETSYPNRVMDGIRHIRAGQPDLAAAALQDAFQLDANNPAAWNAYGILLLDAGRIDQAESCFARAQSLDPMDPNAAMGLGVASLARRRLKDASTHFGEAARRSGPAASVMQAYVEALTGNLARAKALLRGGPDVPLARAVSAFVERPAGRASLGDWRSALETADNAANNHEPLLASFFPAAPLTRTWQAARIPTPPKAGQAVVAGIVTLRGDDGPDVRSAAFYIDGGLASVTNVSPFAWSWNTAEYPNGAHLIRIEVRRNSGASSIRERRVRTQNVGAASAPAYAGMEEIDRQLSAMLTLPPDPRFARFTLARAAIASGNTAEARRRLEAVVGQDPGYLNSVALLGELPRTATTDEIWHGPATGRRIALTFDDGPVPTHTPQLLDTLAALNVPATFFVVGKMAAAYPDIVRRMAREGHEVENHTWRHHNLRHMNGLEAMRELASTRRLIGMLTGRPSRYFRPPGGNISMAARQSAALLDIQPVMWTYASGKAEGLPVEEMIPRFVRAARPGAIYLIHNGTDKIEAAIPIVVKQLRAKGYTFVTLEELVTGRREARPGMHTAGAPPAKGSEG